MAEGGFEPTMLLTKTLLSFVLERASTMSIITTLTFSLQVTTGSTLTQEAHTTQFSSVATLPTTKLASGPKHQLSTVKSTTATTSTSGLFERSWTNHR